MTPTLTRRWTGLSAGGILPIPVDRTLPSRVALTPGSVHTRVNCLWTRRLWALLSRLRVRLRGLLFEILMSSTLFLDKVCNLIVIVYHVYYGTCLLLLWGLFIMFMFMVIVYHVFVYFKWLRDYLTTIIFVIIFGFNKKLISWIINRALDSKTICFCFEGKYKDRWCQISHGGIILSITNAQVFCFSKQYLIEDGLV